MVEATNTLRTGLFLNYAVFLYENCDLVEDARFMANRGFNEALADLEKLNDA